MKLGLRSSLIAVVIAVSLAAGLMHSLCLTCQVPVQDAVVGTLRGVDNYRETITVTTPMGVETLSLPPSAPVHQGAHSLAMQDLRTHVGERVKIWYRSAGWGRTVTEVRLAATGPDAPDHDAAR